MSVVDDLLEHAREANKEAKRAARTKPCAICDTPFIPYKNKKTCSEACAKELLKERNRDSWYNNKVAQRRKSRQGKPAQIRIRTIHCEICTKVVETGHKLQKICDSDECGREKRRRYERSRRKRLKEAEEQDDILS